MLNHGSTSKEHDLCLLILARSFTTTKSSIVRNNFLPASLIATSSFGFTKAERYEKYGIKDIAKAILKYHCKQSFRKMTSLMIRNQQVEKTESKIFEFLADYQWQIIHS